MVDCHPLKSIVNLGSASVDNVSSGWQSTMSSRKECNIYIMYKCKMLDLYVLLIGLYTKKQVCFTCLNILYVNKKIILL